MNQCLTDRLLGALNTRIFSRACARWLTVGGLQWGGVKSTQTMKGPGEAIGSPMAEVFDAKLARCRTLPR